MTEFKRDATYICLNVSCELPTLYFYSMCDLMLVFISLCVRDAKYKVSAEQVKLIVGFV